MDSMSIASLSMALYQNQALSQIGTAVLSMSLDDATSQAETTVAVLDALPAPSLDPSVGGNFDMSV